MEPMELATVALRAVASARGGFGPALGDGATYAATDGPARLAYGAL